jgi:hypothetical protein
MHEDSSARAAAASLVRENRSDANCTSSSSLRWEYSAEKLSLFILPTLPDHILDYKGLSM